MIEIEIEIEQGRASNPPHPFYYSATPAQLARPMSTQALTPPAHRAGAPAHIAQIAGQIAGQIAPEDAAMIAEHRRASKAENTIRAYRSGLQGNAQRTTKDGAPRNDGRKFPTFETFCAQRGYQLMPAAPEVVEAYLGTLAKMGAKVATIEQRRAAIGYVHEIAGHANPCKSPQVKEAMKGIRRKLGVMARPKDHLSPDELARVVAALPDTLRGKRDRALLLMGELGAFRRSELVALDVNDVTIRRDSDGEVMSVLVRQSKTDQEGEGLYKTLPALPDKTICPITAYHAWLNAAGIRSGRVFRAIDRWEHVRAGGMDGQEVARIVKRAAAAAGLDARRFAGHSLRSGYVTAATLAGANDGDIMEQTGHRSSATLRRYKQMAGKGAKRATFAAFGAK